MAKYILSPNAQKSLLQIKYYSTDKFGKRQTEFYLHKIREKFRLLSDNPNIGQSRNEIKNGVFSSIIFAHVIYYRINQENIEIIDVLHQRMDPNLHLHESDKP